MSKDRPFRRGALLEGGYRLVRRINRGGSADIHLASHARKNSNVIVKSARSDAPNAESIASLRREAQIMAKLRHPNIVKLIDFAWTQTGLPYLVLEHLPGMDLADVLTKRGKLSAEQTLSIVRQLASALNATHRASIVHRDLKPQNVMLVPRPGKADLVKVIDFGASKLHRGNKPGRSSLVVGTPEFMSPEQAAGNENEVGHQSDVFALAVLAYSLLTGRVPWRGKRSSDVLYEVAQAQPLPLDRSGALEHVERVILRAMAKLPGQRHVSALAFARELEKAMRADRLLRRHPTDKHATVPRTARHKKG